MAKNLLMHLKQVKDKEPCSSVLKKESKRGISRSKVENINFDYKVHTDRILSYFPIYQGIQSFPLWLPYFILLINATFHKTTKFPKAESNEGASEWKIRSKTHEFSFHSEKFLYQISKQSEFSYKEMIICKFHLSKNLLWGLIWMFKIKNFSNNSNKYIASTSHKGIPAFI